MTTFSQVSLRDEKRQELQRDMERFLSAGRRVTVVPTNTWSTAPEEKLPNSVALRGHITKSVTEAKNKKGKRNE